MCCTLFYQCKMCEGEFNNENELFVPKRKINRRCAIYFFSFLLCLFTVELLLLFFVFPLYLFFVLSGKRLLSSFENNRKSNKDFGWWRAFFSLSFQLTHIFPLYATLPPLIQSVRSYRRSWCSKTIVKKYLGIWDSKSLNDWFWNFRRNFAKVPYFIPLIRLCSFTSSVMPSAEQSIEWNEMGFKLTHWKYL